MDRCVAHLDLDAFYASVELQRRPELRGKPVIVSGSGPRAVVTTATYEARRFGVGSAMPTSRARRLCPEAILVPPDFPAYRAASQTVWDLVRAEVETVEQAGIDEGYLDLTGFLSPKAAMRRLVGEIRATTGLSASVGIGPSRLVAKVASDCEKPAGLVSLSREGACERFASSPPGLLPGIGPKTAERLSGLGIDTLAALRAADVAALRGAFGENLGVFLHRRAHFEDDAPVKPERELKSQSSERTFDTDVAGVEEQEAIIGELAADLSRRLRGRELRGRSVGIKVRLDDWTTVTRARTLEHATFDEATLRTVALDLLRAYGPARPVRLLGVRVAGFEAEAEAQADQLRLAV